MARLAMPDVSRYIVPGEDPLESQAFYEMCQAYRHAKEWQEAGRPSVGDGFEWVKQFVRENAEEILRHACD